MNNFDHIMRAYEAADFERRLDIFLRCPPLRAAFIEIDQRSGPEAKKTVGAAGSKKPSVWRRVLSYAHLV